MSLVVVAIPREDDPVWKISSEKVPHLTLLFLADSPQQDKIVQFVEHAAKTSLTRFGLDVDRRGELGEDIADVLFFQDNWELPRVRGFREMLLKEPNIKTAYDSTTQFDGWTPHLTLGYPESPAKPTSERIYWVQFDRIAVWDGEYEGPEFVLENEYAMEVMMTDHAALGRNFMAHYGVLGMKWGKRKPRDESERAKEFKANPAKATSAKKGFLNKKTVIDVEGGDDHPAHPEALRVAESRAKLKKSGVAALSNRELQEVQNRLNLEQNVARLEENQTSSGKKFVKNLLGQQAKQVVTSETTRLVSDAQRKRGR